LGKEYAVYIDSFKQNNVNGFRLLNDVDETKLVQYGVKNRRHQQFILKSIVALKTQVSTESSTEKK
jgi:hypothetical protein